jgi:hypothetical protein
MYSGNQNKGSFDGRSLKVCPYALAGCRYLRATLIPFLPGRTTGSAAACVSLAEKLENPKAKTSRSPIA